MSKQNVTPWYPPDVHPVREGWYETKLPYGAIRGVITRRYWSITRHKKTTGWYWDEACMDPCVFQCLPWRGIKRPIPCAVVQIGVPGNPFWSIE